MTLETPEYNNISLTINEEKVLKSSVESGIKQDIQKGLPDKKLFYQMIGDSELFQIYLAMAKRPYSRIEIGKKLGIPSTSAFRKVNWLYENHLVNKYGIKKTSKNHQRFKACFTRIKIEFSRDFELLHATESKEIEK